MSESSCHDLIGGGPLDADDMSRLGRAFAWLEFEQDALPNDGIDHEEVSIGAAHGHAACIAKLEDARAFDVYHRALPDRLRDVIDDYRLADVESAALGSTDGSKEIGRPCQHDPTN